MDVRGERSAFVVSPELDALLKKHFCIVFAGNLGTAQALDTLVQAAVQLRDEPEIRIVLVGSGSRLDWLKSQQKALGLDNLVLPGRFPMEAMTAIFEQSSALLVSLNNEEAFAQTIPSKIQAYLAAGRPIIASMNGEGARVVCEAGAGLVSAAEHVSPLVANIRLMKALGAEERAVMGESGRAWFDAHFEMQSQAIRLVELLQR
jgi:glycosyltransferase involved in cell wall biosynthesis